MTITHIVFIALASAALVGLLAYRMGLSTGARSQRLLNHTTQNAQAASLRDFERTIKNLRQRQAALLTAQTETEARARQCEARSDAHQAQLEAIMQDADARVAIYARRANPFDQADLTTLLAAANQLAAAASVYTSLHADDQTRFAQQMQQRLQGLAERLRTALQASEQLADQQAAA